MPARIGRIIAALAVLLAGLVMARRSSGRREIPVPPGIWEPVGDGD